MAPKRTWSWPLRLLAIQIGCCSADETIYPSLATAVGWAENLTLQNLEGKSTRPAVQSNLPYCLEKDPVIFCTQNCLDRMAFCASFSYVTTSTHCICKLYGTPNFLIEKMNPKEGSRYFYAIDKRCPVQKGYRLLHLEAKRDLCLLYLGKMSVNSETAMRKCAFHDGVLPKLTNKYVTDVIIEYVGANTREGTIMIQAGAKKINDVWLWEFDSTPISTQPRSVTEGSPDDLSYWNHTFWYGSPHRVDFYQKCMYTDEDGWFTDHCDTMEKDVVCQYRMSGSPWQDPAFHAVSSVASLSVEVMVVATLAVILTLWPPLHLGL